MTNNNYSGDWMDSESWNPAWENPDTSISSYDVIIYGNILLNGSLALEGNYQSMLINDTLVIMGDLEMQTNYLYISDEGILIVGGDLIIDGTSYIVADNYLIVSGDFYNKDTVYSNYFYSNSYPEKIFICGDVIPSDLTENSTYYPVLNCSSPTNPYSYSGCSYGNEDDLENDSIYSFYANYYLPSFPEITASGNLEFCWNDSLILIADEASSYLWTTGDTTREITVKQSGSYAVQVSYSNGSTSEYSDTVVVKVNPLPSTPVITASGDLEICRNDSLILTADEASSYLWTTGDTTREVTVKQSGNYAVQVSNSYGCNSEYSDTIAVMVNKLPSVPVITPGGSINMCEGESVNLTSSAADSYTWSNGEITQYITVDQSGEYTVEITDSNNCKNKSEIVIIEVVSNPDVSILSSDNYMCEDAVRIISGSPEGGFFTVLSGPGVISDNTLSATGEGTIRLEYFYQDVCADSVCQDITVKATPTADAGQDVELTMVDETQMDAQLLYGETGSWLLSSGTGIIEDEQSAVSTVSGLSVGENIFQWTVSNGYCTDSAFVVLTINKLRLPNAITPNGDGKNDYLIVGDFDETIEFIVFNRWGTIVFRDKDYENDWDGKDNSGNKLPDDTYYYIISLEDGTVEKSDLLIKY